MDVEIRQGFAVGSELLGISVVVDVLRATTTCSVLLSRAPSVRLVATPNDLPPLVAELGGRAIVVSEIDSVADRVDNSPVLASKLPLERRTPVLVTRNGTRAVNQVFDRSQQVLIASFLNVKGILQWVRETKPDLVTLVPAGSFAFSRRAAEDDALAEFVHASLLAETLVDPEPFQQRCRLDERVQQRLAKEPGLADDLEFALTTEPGNYPVGVVGNDALGYSVRPWSGRGAPQTG